MKDFILMTTKAQELKEKVENHYNSPEERVRKLFYERKAPVPYVPSKFISPSGMGCPIACCFKLQGLELPGVAESFFDRGKADSGSDRHERIQGFLATQEFDKTIEWVNLREYIERIGVPIIVLKDDGYEYLLQHRYYPLRYKCDGMLKIDGKYYILEIKTEGEKKNLDRRGFNPDHEFQGVTYATTLNAEGVIWLYEGRDSCDPKTFLQIVTKGDRQLVKKYIEDIVANKETPFDKFKPEEKCTYCEYRKHCREVYKAWKKNQK